MDGTEEVRLPFSQMEIVNHENLYVAHEGTEARRNSPRTQEVSPWAHAHLLVYGRPGGVLLGLRKEISGLGVP
jgi:hypothetical protein